MAELRHFLDLDQIDPATLRDILDRGSSYKKGRANGGHPRPLAGKTLAMIFEKPSTRTRVSFEVGMRELGGQTVMLGTTDTQLGRGESIADTARVLSRFVHGLIVRTFDHTDVEELARWGTVPVVNALTDFLHPCQVYTDAYTAAERWTPPGGNEHNYTLVAHIQQGANLF